MKKNMGSTDKLIRIIIAIAIAALYYFNVIPNNTFGTVLLVLAVIFVLTSVVGFCPLYKPLGMNTNKAKKE